MSDFNRFLEAARAQLSWLRTVRDVGYALEWMQVDPQLLAIKKRYVDEAIAYLESRLETK